MVKINEKKLTECMGSVTGHRGDGTPVAFTLTPLEIKHIRRCIHVYNRLHPPIQPAQVERDESLHAKFKQFGRITAFGSKARNDLRKQKARKCVACGATKDLTLDHIVPRRDGGNNTAENIQVLCKICHEEKNLNERITTKEEEVEFLKNKLFHLFDKPHP